MVQATEILFRFHLPSIVVVKLAASRYERIAPIRSINRLIRMECRRRAIEIGFVLPRLVRGFFLRYGCKTNDDIARLIAEWFPELSWNLPRKRQPWTSEGYSVAAFEAAAIGITFLSKFCDTKRYR